MFLSQLMAVAGGGGSGAHLACLPAHKFLAKAMSYHAQDIRLTWQLIPIALMAQHEGPRHLHIKKKS